MTDRIKLMSDEIVLKIAENFPARVTHNMVRDECEKRATEKIREVAEYFYHKALLSNKYQSLKGEFWSQLDYEQFQKVFQQYLKEQDGE